MAFIDRRTLLTGAAATALAGPAFAAAQPYQIPAPKAKGAAG